MTQDAQTLHISSLGHRGDGIADTPDGGIFVAGALPGEEIRARVDKGRAHHVEILSASPDRIDPICRHIDECGGCTVQHLAQKPYLAWKRDLVINALGTHAIETNVQPAIPGQPHSRRRAVLTASRVGGAILLGYHQKGSHKLMDVRECPVLVPSIVRLLPGLRRLSTELMPKKGDLRFTVLMTKAGADVSVEGAARDYAKRLPALTQGVMDLDLARLSVNGEIILEVRPPQLIMSKIAVVAPPGGFTQATEEAEDALSELVVTGLGKSKRVADLFSGSGTFALRIAKKANVHAVEGDAASVKALDRALRHAQGLKMVTTERRDLFRRPLMAAELNAFDGVVFDPPRAGADTQAEQLAASTVKRVIAVSCNPATLARDLKTLMDGGYSLTSVTPVDQFLFSSHVEVVAVLERL
ncbi:class I SAM-dependent RNA methyltransferase [Roseibium sp. CAU 1637]|uniref:Class I SAM-dependent RNA methyltransferase n=1 Tax=Roseibium limicola TaxID=2816037 RepID=A0A939EQ62_9HYPH|nr:class I SAM-dependent RNA methyltransferase [Roseibium limicola]MBO0345483.1 class I SAM-dependent RNA methyltransferase [Roseibium limicola]